MAAEANILRREAERDDLLILGAYLAGYVSLAEASKAGVYLLYNPNHDEKGRFAAGGGSGASSGGGGGVQSSAGGSGAELSGVPMRNESNESSARTFGPRTFNLASYTERYGVDYHAADTAAAHARNPSNTETPPAYGKELASVQYEPDDQSLRFSAPVTPEQQERGTMASHVRSQLEWARYDAHTGELIREGAESLKPTVAEHEAWSAEARHLAQQWQGHLNELSREDLYIRFGDLPHGGRSMNFATGQHEAGVSVYHARYNLRSGRLEFDDGKVFSWGSLVHLMSRPAHLVTGRYAGLGGDGEPVLESPRIVAHLQYDHNANGYTIKDGSK